MVLDNFQCPGDLLIMLPEEFFFFGGGGGGEREVGGHNVAALYVPILFTCILSSIGRIITKHENCKYLRPLCISSACYDLMIFP